MRFVHDPLSSHGLYLTDLAARLDRMESGRLPMNPKAYRLYARRLKSALAGYPAPAVREQLCRRHPGIAHALEVRHFDEHGLLLGPGAPAAAAIALSLFSVWMDR